MTETAISPLRQRMIDDMTVRHFVEKTRTDYIRQVRGLVTLRGLTEMGSATCPSLCHYTRRFAPRVERLGSEEPVRASGSEVTRNGEDVVGGRVHRQEPLG